MKKTISIVFLCFAFLEISYSQCLTIDFDGQPEPSNTQSVCFTNLSKSDDPPIQYLWHFGDGTTSTEESPCHYYNIGSALQQSGKEICFTVILEGTDAAGNTRTKERKDICIPSTEISGELGVNIEGINCDPFNPAAIGAVDQNITFNGQAYGGVPPYEYEWDFGNAPLAWSASTINGKGPIDVVYSAGGQGRISLKVTDSEGTSVTTFCDVEVLPDVPGDIQIKVSSDFPCGGDDIQFIADMPPPYEYHGIVTYEWIVDGQSFPYASWIHNHTFPEPVLPEIDYDVTVQFKVTDDYGTYTSIKTIKVHKCPIGPPPPIEVDVKVSKSQTGPWVDQVTINPGESHIVWIKGEFLNRNPENYCSGLNAYNTLFDDYDAASWERFYNGTPQFEIDTEGSHLFYMDFSGWAGCTDLEFFAEEHVTWICKDCTGPPPVLITDECYPLPFDPAKVGFPNGEPNREDIVTPFYKTCAIKVVGEKPEITNVNVHSTTDCESTILEVVAQKGVTKSSVSSLCGNLQNYSGYAWEAFERYDSEVKIEDLFIEGENGKCTRVNYKHEYFDKFDAGERLEFFVKVQVIDYVGEKAEYFHLVSLDPPLRIEFPALITRCEGTEDDKLNEARIAYGGAEPYTFMWDTEIAEYFVPESTKEPDPILTLRSIPNYLESEFIVTDDDGCSIVTGFTFRTNTMSGLNLPNMVNACSRRVITGLTPIIIQLPNYESSQEIGPTNLDFGGSGEYSYEWTSDNSLIGTMFLSDPFIPNPTVWGLQTSDIDSPLNIPVDVIYTLTVTDLMNPDCFITAQVTVSPTSIFNGIWEEPGIDQNIANGNPICFDSPNQIVLGAPSQSYNPDLLSLEWKSTNSNFQSIIDDPNPSLPIEVNKLPGIETYTLKQVALASGCTKTDDVEIEVLPQWKYEGFESDYVYTQHFPFNSVVYPAWSSVNNQIITNSQDSESGAHSPFIHKWEDPTILASSTPPGGSHFPSQGDLVLSPQTPKSTNLTVTDAFGCQKNFRTNRYELYGGPPSIRVETLPSTAICAGEEMCFNVQLSTYYMREPNTPIQLPHSVEIGYTALFGGEPNEPIGIPQPESQVPGVLVPPEFCFENTTTISEAQSWNCFIPLILELVDGDQGVYEGEICFTIEHPSTFIQDQLNRIRFYGDFNTPWIEEIFFSVYGSSPSFSSQQIIEINRGYSANELEIGPDAFFNPQAFPTNIDPDFMGGEWVMFTHDVGEFNTEVSALGGTFSFGFSFDAFINPCDQRKPSITKKEVANTPLKEIKESQKLFESPPDKHEFIVFPNPFDGGVSLNYIVGVERISNVTIRIFDSTGKLHDEIIKDEQHLTGEYLRNYNASNLSPGIYFFELLIDNTRLVRKGVKIGNR